MHNVVIDGSHNDHFLFCSAVTGEERESVHRPQRVKDAAAVEIAEELDLQ